MKSYSNSIYKVYGLEPEESDFRAKLYRVAIAVVILLFVGLAAMLIPTRTANAEADPMVNAGICQMDRSECCFSGSTWLT